MNQSFVTGADYSVNSETYAKKTQSLAKKFCRRFFVQKFCDIIQKIFGVDFMKKIALITGLYGGRGKCFAEIHAKNSGDLILVGCDENKLSEQKKNICENCSVNVETFAVDLSLSDSAQKIILKSII